MVTIGLLYIKAGSDRTTMTAMLAGSDGISTVEHLLMLGVDELRVSNWMRSKDGSKNRNRPRPISPLSRRKEKRHGTPVDLPTAAAMLAKYGPAPKPVPAEVVTVDSDAEESV